MYWPGTVRRDGRPHVTPLIAVWYEGAFYFCTGAREQKAKNLEQNPHCTVTTGCNTYNQGLDIVLEGDATRITDEALLQRIADAYEAKYGSDWHWDVRDSAFHGSEGNVADVFAITPTKALGFAKGAPFGQTRWRF